MMLAKLMQNHRAPPPALGGRALPPAPRSSVAPLARLSLSLAAAYCGGACLAGSSAAAEAVQLRAIAAAEAAESGVVARRRNGGGGSDSPNPRQAASENAEMAAILAWDAAQRGKLDPSGKIFTNFDSRLNAVIQERPEDAPAIAVLRHKLCQYAIHVTKSDAEESQQEFANTMRVIMALLSALSESISATETATGVTKGAGK